MSLGAHAESLKKKPNIMNFIIQASVVQKGG